MLEHPCCIDSSGMLPLSGMLVSVWSRCHIVPKAV